MDWMAGALKTLVLAGFMFGFSILVGLKLSVAQIILVVLTVFLSDLLDWTFSLRKK